MHTQAPIGLALELRNEVALADIKSIHIDTYKSAASSASDEPEKWDPKTRETADHSIPFLVAAALQEGAVVPGTFTPRGIADATKRDTMAKMPLSEDPEFTAKYPAEYNCRITITSQSGEVHTAHTPFSKGHKNNPLDDQELEAKFRSFASGVLSERQCDQILETIWNVDEASDMDDLFDGLVVSPGVWTRASERPADRCFPPGVLGFGLVANRIYGVKSNASTIPLNGNWAVTFTSLTKSSLSDSNKHMHRESPGINVLRI